MTEEIPFDEFENKIVSIKEVNIPELEELDFLPISKAYWKVILLRFLAFFIVISGISTLLIAQEPEIALYKVYISVGIIIFFLILMTLSYISFKRKAYQLRTHDVLFREGILSTKTTILPINRIQQVKIQEGFFSKFFKLATIGIFTAGGQANAQVRIPGVPKENAHKIRTFLISKIKEFNE